MRRTVQHHVDTVPLELVARRRPRRRRRRRRAGQRHPGAEPREHQRGGGLGEDVKVILTPPCIFCIENH